MVDIRKFLGTSCRLRDDIPRDPLTPRLNGTIYMYGMWPPRDVSVRERDLHFSVAREQDVRICGGRVCAGTVFHIYPETAGFLSGLDCRVVHPTRSYAF